ELIGEFKNPGRTWNKIGEAKEVNVYDFPNLGMGKAAPYGIYDTGRNEGMVNVGKSHDISKFAVESIRQWWLLMG
ncbi:Transposase, Rhodopirellula-type, partial [mine drainage metagenome]